MAKPGSNGARKVSAGGAVDLGKRTPVPEALEREGRANAEANLGMRCGGCGKRIGVGLQFTRIDIVRGDDGRPVADVLKLSACNGADGCDFAAKAREGADVVEMVEFVWLVGEEPVGGEQALPDAVQAAEDAARGEG